MLIPMADVPRWFAERKPKDAIAISQGRYPDLGAARAQRQPPRPRFCGQGRQARRFRRHWPTQQQHLFRNHLCGMEVWCDTDLADLAVAARRGRRRARNSQAFARGRRPARLECAQFGAGQFHAGRFFGRTFDEPGRALLEGDDQRRLDRTAEGDPRSPARGDRDRSHIAVRDPHNASLLNPGPALSQRAVHRVAYGAVHRRAGDRHREIRCRGDAAPDRSQQGAMGQFRADHDASHLGAAGGSARQLRRLQSSDRVPHGGSDAALAEGKMDRVARAGADL